MKFSMVVCKSWICERTSIVIGCISITSIRKRWWWYMSSKGISLWLAHLQQSWYVLFLSSIFRDNWWLYIRWSTWSLLSGLCSSIKSQMSIDTLITIVPFPYPSFSHHPQHSFLINWWLLLLYLVIEWLCVIRCIYKEKGGGTRE